MPHTINYTACPVCHSTRFTEILRVKDHTASKQDFMIVQCPECSLRFTQEVPDQNNIGAFYKSENYISHTDTAKGFINTMYHRVRRITLQSKATLIEKETGHSAGNLLDIGAGTGAFAYTMQQKGWQITGLEPDSDAKKVASDKYGLSFEDAAMLYHLPEEKFDAITLWHVLEHIHDLNAYLQTIHKMLKPGGKLFIAVPNYTSYDAAHYQANWAAYDVPRHLYHFSPKSMQVLMQKHQLTITRIKPMWFDSFYVSLLSEQYKTGFGQLIKAFITGLVSNIKAIFANDKCSSLIYVAEKVK